MKKFISICLCIVLALPTFAYAQTNPKNTIEAAIENSFDKKAVAVLDKELITKEVSDLESRMYIPSDSLTAIKENADGTYIYIYNISGIESEITPIENEDGYGFIIKEGSLENELIFTPDGKIILDGNEVKVTYESDDENLPEVEEIDHKLYIDGVLVEPVEVSVNSDESNYSNNNFMTRSNILRYTTYNTLREQLWKVIQLIMIVFNYYI